MNKEILVFFTHDHRLVFVSTQRTCHYESRPYFHGRQQSGDMSCSLCECRSQPASEKMHFGESVRGHAMNHHDAPFIHSIAQDQGPDIEILPC